MFFLGKGRPPTIWCNHIALICFIHCPNFIFWCKWVIPNIQSEIFIIQQQLSVVIHLYEICGPVCDLKQPIWSDLRDQKMPQQGPSNSLVIHDRFGSGGKVGHKHPLTIAKRFASQALPVCLLVQELVNDSRAETVQMCCLTLVWQ